MSVATEALPEGVLEGLRRAGNPFRNYFARNPDDEVCARFHVPELFARERSQLLAVVDLYRNDPATHSEIIPVLGNKGSGKTHLLHSIKHGTDGGWQLLVTPGTYQKDTEFLEYLLFQVIDTLLGGGKQRGKRPLEYVSEDLGRRLLQRALSAASRDEILDLFPAPGLGRWTRKLGLGTGQALERAQWLIDTLSRPGSFAGGFAPLRRICAEGSLECERAFELVTKRVEKTEPHNTAGLMRRHLYVGFARAALLGDEADLANFLTYGFAELDFKVRPTRQDLVLALFKVLMEGFLNLKIPVVVAFDQLEDLLLVRRTDDGHRIAEAFFAGIVQAMHQIDGLCFLIFAERGLWNRFVPSLDGYIQDRLNNPIHVPQHGTIKTLRLEAPAPELVRRVVEARLRPALEELPDFADLPPIFPFTEEEILRIARTEPTLRDMLQQFRYLFDHVVFGPPAADQETGRQEDRETGRQGDKETEEAAMLAVGERRLPADGLPIVVKSVTVVESSDSPPQDQPAAGSVSLSPCLLVSLSELWGQEMETARRQLEPDGALTGATRELQAGLGKFLQVCQEHGIKVGPWRLSHVVPEWAFGEHPTYGVISIAHWVCKDGQPWKVGIGPFLGRGSAKPRDLGIKLAALDVEPAVIDHLILLRPEDEATLTGKTKALWQAAARRGRHARLEAVRLGDLAVLYGFPRWLAAVAEALPAGQALPNLAEFLPERCEKLLEQLCMPVQA